MEFRWTGAGMFIFKEFCRVAFYLLFFFFKAAGNQHMILLFEVMFLIFYLVSAHQIAGVKLHVPKPNWSDSERKGTNILRLAG